MILCLDVGNTRVKMAVMEAGRILAGESVATPVKRRDEAIRRVSSAVLALDGVVFSSVVPDAAPGVAESVNVATGLRPAAVTYRSVFPFELAVAEPERVGIDRLCSAAGALPGKRRNAIVVDAGTAVTVDMIRDGRFLGVRYDRTVHDSRRARFRYRRGARGGPASGEPGGDCFTARHHRRAG